MKRSKIKKIPYTYKDKNGITRTEDRFLVLWSYHLGKRLKRKEKRFKNKRHADLYAAKIDRDIADGIHIADSDTVTFGTALKAWFEDCKKRRSVGDLYGNTLTNYEWALPRLQKLERIPLNKFTHDHARDWVFELLKEPSPHTGKPLAGHSVDNHYGYLLLVLKFAVRKGWLRRNPLLDEPVRIPGKRKKRVDVPMSEDIEKLINWMSGPKPPKKNFLGWTNDKIGFALATFGGLRVGEIAALHYKNVDLPGARLMIDAEKGSVSVVDGLKEPKSDAGARSVPMCQYLYDAFLDHIHESGSHEGFVIKNSKHPDSPTPTGPQEITKSHREMMRAAGMVKENGKTIKFTTHGLRHWYISMCMKLGINSLNVSRRVGHAQPSFTMNIYGHVLDGDEDGLPADVDPIWKARLSRANPDLPRIIDATASEILMIEGPRLAETAHEDSRVPPAAPPWIPEAIRLLEGGWRVSDVQRHLGLTDNIFRAFSKAGLPTPNTFMREARHRRFQKLLDQGYGISEIARMTNVSQHTVWAWKEAEEHGKPNNAKTLKELQKMRKQEGVFSGKMREFQPKLL